MATNVFGLSLSSKGVGCINIYMDKYLSDNTHTNKNPDNT